MSTIENPQLEDGYTRIANPIMDALAHTHFSGNERQVLDFILRRTYGWNKKSDKITITQFVLGTGIDRRHVISSIKTLTDRRVIDNDSAKIGTREVRTYGLNKYYNEWLIVPKRTLVLKTSLVPKKVQEIVPKLAPLRKDIKDTKDKRSPIAPKKEKRTKPEITPEVAEVLAYLNLRTGRRYREPCDIGARLKDNYTVEDCKLVIDKKVIEWEQDSKMRMYLTPKTLFAKGNFDTYLNQPDPQGTTRTSDGQIHRLNHVIEPQQNKRPGPICDLSKILRKDD